MIKPTLPPLLCAAFAFMADRLFPFAVFAVIAAFHASTFALQISAFAPLVGQDLAGNVRAVLAVDCLFLGVATLASAAMALLVVFRYAPTNRFAGFGALVAALVGWMGPFGFLALQRQSGWDVNARLVSDSVLLIAALGTLVALLSLGRSFAVLPSARRLVTGGLYRWSRHPVYLGEIALVLATVARDFSLAAVALGCVVCSAQIMRIRYEERLLLTNFGEAYRAYAARVGILGPWGRRG